MPIGTIKADVLIDALIKDTKMRGIDERVILHGFVKTIAQKKPLLALEALRAVHEVVMRQPAIMSAFPLMHMNGKP